MYHEHSQGNNPLAKFEERTENEFERLEAEFECFLNLV